MKLPLEWPQLGWCAQRVLRPAGSWGDSGAWKEGYCYERTAGRGTSYKQASQILAANAPGPLARRMSSSRLLLSWAPHSSFVEAKTRCFSCHFLSLTLLAIKNTPLLPSALWISFAIHFEEATGEISTFSYFFPNCSPREDASPFPSSLCLPELCASLKEKNSSHTNPPLIAMQVRGDESLNSEGWGEKQDCLSFILWFSGG